MILPRKYRSHFHSDLNIHGHYFYGGSIFFRGGGPYYDRASHAAVQRLFSIATTSEVFNNSKIMARLFLPQSYSHGGGDTTNMPPACKFCPLKLCRDNYAVIIMFVVGTKLSTITSFATFNMKCLVTNGGMNPQ